MKEVENAVQLRIKLHKESGNESQQAEKNSYFLIETVGKLPKNFIIFFHSVASNLIFFYLTGNYITRINCKSHVLFLRLCQYSLESLFLFWETLSWNWIFYSTFPNMSFFCIKKEIFAYGMAKFDSNAEDSKYTFQCKICKTRCFLFVLTIYIIDKRPVERASTLSTSKGFSFQMKHWGDFENRKVAVKRQTFSQWSFWFWFNFDIVFTVEGKLFSKLIASIKDLTFTEDQDLEVKVKPQSDIPLKLLK